MKSILGLMWIGGNENSFERRAMKTTTMHNTTPHTPRISRVSQGVLWATGLLFSLAVASPVWGDTVTLEPLADNWISSCSTGCSVNNGTMDELRVRSSWWGSPGNREPKNFRPLLAFDVASLPVDEDLITQATLGLYYFTKPHDDPVGRTYEVHRLTNAWEETDSTWQARDDYNTPDPDYWDTYSAGTPSYQPGGGDFVATPYASATVPGSTGQWMTWDITLLIQEWVAGTYDNLGLLLKDSTEFESDPGGGTVSYLACFRSHEHTNAALRPHLEVTYIPEPSSLGLMGLGLVVLLRRRSKQ